MLKRLFFIIYIFLAGLFFIPQNLAGFFVNANLGKLKIPSRLWQAKSDEFTRKQELGVGIMRLTRKKIAYAAEVPEVVINEIMWMGSSVSSNDEWIELRNMTSHDIDLSEWTIEGAATAKGVLAIPKDDIEHIIPAGGFYLISHYSIADRVLDTNATIIDVIVDLKIKSISLANKYNDNGQLILKDKGGNQIDKTPVADSAKWSAGEYKSKEAYHSMERNNPAGNGADENNWHTCAQAVNLIAGAIECGTPRAENSEGKAEDGEAAEGGEGEPSFTETPNLAEVEADKEGADGGDEIDGPKVMDGQPPEGEEGETQDEEIKKLEIKKLDDNAIKGDSNKTTHSPSLLRRGAMVAGKIVINEIYSYPELLDFNNEFIELKNIC